MAPVPNNNNNESNSDNKPKANKSSRPSLPSSATGFMMARLDIVEDIMAAAEDHKKKCHCALKKRQCTSGFEVHIDLYCLFCKKSYQIRSGPKPPEQPSTKTPQKRGPKTSQLNMIMTGAAHKAAIPVTHFQDFCHEVGCVSPSEKGAFLMLDKRKDATRKVCEEVLQKNRIEHVAAIKNKYGDKHIIKHTDKEGKVHNICYGTVSADGAGDKRAYNHIITGSQHSTVVFSMLTDRVIAVKHDQVSCGLCDKRMTKLLKENKRADEIADLLLFPPDRRSSGTGCLPTISNLRTTTAHLLSFESSWLK
jgi:hypothetical protein